MSLGNLGIQALISKYSQDVIAIFSQGSSGEPLKQLIPEVNIMKASINTNATVFRHPLADGSTIVDHRILEPVEIELILILSTTRKPFTSSYIDSLFPNQDNLRNTYNTLLEYYNNSYLIGIQTRTSYYSNMILSAIPHQENVDVYNGAILSLKAQETKFALPTVNIFVPLDPNDQSTIDRGEQQSISTTENQQSAASAILDNLTGSVSNFWNDND